ncbi:MAG: hypothetical protein GQ549_08210 [Gammaproteobacteria bacterium]|nr:hypothetical protein [Gammaproteobacteria bacterium]
MELYRQTGDVEDLQLALKLVDQVHFTLGKHHKDSEHSGWLSGLDEEQARLHPTIAGLRIGKQLNERQADEAYDDRLEWDRDGQYFHYLTKWMHALNRVSQVTGKSIYNQWALDLARAAHAAFTYTPASGGCKRMYWKMSIGLSRAQVPSMGQHDPLDGLITYQQLEASAKGFSEAAVEFSLKTEIEELEAMCVGRNWATEDPLGIGGLLTDAYRLVQLIEAHYLHETSRLESLLDDIEISLQAFASNNQLNLPAEYRLAFRELGLAIGLQTIARMQKTIEQHAENFTNPDQLNATLNKLTRFKSINEFIEGFWLEPEHRSVDSWLQHADINNVMLATSMAPDGFLN